MSLISTIRDALTQKQAARHETAIEQYSRLVTDLADGTSRDDHGEIETILRETGLTIDDVESDVDGLKERRQWGKQLKPLQSLKDQRAGLQNQIDVAKQNADAATKAYDDLRESLQPQLVDFGAQIAQLDGINGKLSAANFEAGKRGLGRVE